MSSTLLSSSSSFGERIAECESPNPCVVDTETDESTDTDDDEHDKHVAHNPKSDLMENEILAMQLFYARKELSLQNGNGEKTEHRDPDSPSSVSEMNSSSGSDEFQCREGCEIGARVHVIANVHTSGGDDIICPGVIICERFDGSNREVLVEFDEKSTHHYDEDWFMENEIITEYDTEENTNKTWDSLMSSTVVIGDSTAAFIECEICIDYFYSNSDVDVNTTIKAAGDIIKFENGFFRCAQCQALLHIEAENASLTVPS